MLARELAMALCPSVSVTSPCAIERDGQTDLVFGTEASFDQSYSMFFRKFTYLQNQVLLSGTFS